MAREEELYIELKIAWDVYVESIAVKFVKKYDLVNTVLDAEEIKDQIYDFLTANKFDEKGFNFVWKSVKQIDKGLTKKQFFSKYIHQPTGNILDNIDNNATMERIYARLTGKTKILGKRVDKLDSYLKVINQETVQKTLPGVVNTINTNKTVAKNIRKQINEKKSVLRRKSVSSARKVSLRQDIARLTEELKITMTSNAKMVKEGRKFATNYKGYSDVKLRKEYTKLIGVVKHDIVTSQQAVEVSQTFSASASSPVKRTAQTEFVKAGTKKDFKELTAAQNKLPSNEEVLVEWSLSPDHNIIDICDDFAEADSGYGAGIYKLNDAPEPIADSHPNCKCRLISHSTTKKEK